MIKKINHRVGGKKTINRINMKRTKINKKMTQGKIITSQLILRQSKEEITSMKEYQNLMNLLK